MGDALSTLRTRLGEVADLEHALELLLWDQEVMMPPAGAEVRALQVGTLARIWHERRIADDVGELLERADQVVRSLPYDSDDASLVRVTRRQYEKARRVPPELAGEIATTASQAHQVWVQAREASDYPLFRPWLDRMLDLSRRYAECTGGGDEPYDALMDDHEPEMRTDDVRAVFEELQPELTAIAAAAQEEAPQPFESGPFPVDSQRELSLELCRAMGASEESFRLDTAVHPFCSSFGVNDVRLTTRYSVDDLHGTAIFTTLHEAGHGVYEHGVSPALERTPIGTGCSSALHESQSRLWENLVGRSLPFWRWFYPRLQAAFPEALSGVDVETYHRAVNRVRPSFIRVDADEFTYGLHIILRFELELDLLSGALSTADLPEAWNTRFEELLGLEVPNDRLGCLQDTHWSSGLFGYFPSYQLGNVISAQIWERMLDDVPDVEERIEQGDLLTLHGWLRENVYAVGAKLTPMEMLERVTGGGLDAEPYLRYLQGKLATLAV